MKDPKSAGELIEVVNAHLRIVETASSFDARRPTLVAVSSSLSFLLVEDMLGRAWRASSLGGPMVFRTWTIASTEAEDVLAFCGGGDVLPGIPFSLCLNARLAEIELNLEMFRHRTRIQVGATRVSAVQLVQYVANTCGGTHFDPDGISPRSRKPVFELLRRLDSAAPGLGLDMLVNDRNLLQHEVLSVAQSVLRSCQVCQLRAWATSNLAV